MRLANVAAVVLLVGVELSGLGAGAGAQKTDAGKSFTVITPVFHQLVAYSLPAGFQVNPPEQKNAKFYLRETVLQGETVEAWTQMITLTGANGAAKAGMTAPRMIDNLADGYKTACPATFAFEDVGVVAISGQKAHLALASCGNVADEHGAAGARHSETALLVTIEGSEDMYSIQWAERGAASATPLPFADAKWQARFRSLEPVRICAEVAGEKAPYASCVGR